MNNAADDYPRICVEVGLTCETCTEATARQLATVCKGLQGKVIARLFVQLYPHSACAPMARHFAASYEIAGIRPVSKCKKGPSSAPLIAIAAVA